MSVSIIVAVAKNLAIGKENRLLWHISEDLKYFKRTTLGHPVIMGSNTFASMGERALLGRRNIVVSRSRPEGERDGVEFISSLEKAVKIANEGLEQENGEIFIIGGGMIYNTAIDLADRLYLTEVDTIIEDADVYFPEMDWQKWREISRSEIKIDEKSGLKYSFVLYEKLI